MRRSLLLQPTIGSKQTFHSIDLLRGLAAIAVLVVHFRHFFEGGGPLTLAHDLIYTVPALRAPFIRFIYEHGSNAVQLFWAISGFVFVHVYAGQQESLTARKYVVNRVARLYPLHLVTLIAVAVLQGYSLWRYGYYNIYEINDAYHFVLQLAFASEWGFQAGRSFNGPIWSVSLEVLIYGAFYLYLKSVRVNLLSTTVVTALFAALYMKLKSPVLLCGFYFFVGAWAYAVYRIGVERLNRWLIVVAAVAVLGGIGALYVVPGSGARVPMVALLAPLFAALLVLLAAIEQEYGSRVFSWAEPVGNLTYSSYLWHSPLQMAFLLLVAGGLVPITVIFTPAFFPAYLAGTCMFSWLSFRCIERPAQLFTRRLLLPHSRVSL